MRAPFSLFKKTQNLKTLWYARYWDELKQCYSITKSTGIIVQGKKERRAEAFEVARTMLADVQRERAIRPLFLDYVTDFWKADSQYVKTKRLGEEKPLSAEYIKNNQSGIALHAKPYKGFQRLKLDELKARHIQDWMLWALEKGAGIVRLNAVLDAMRVAVRWAVDREDLKIDPFLKVKRLKKQSTEKGILTPTELRRLLAVKEQDTRIRAAVALAALCGLRRGEVRGLQWGDIDEKGGLINIQHNFVKFDGDKTPKWGSDRQVILPSLVSSILGELRKLYNDTPSSGYVLASPLTGDPIGEAAIRGGFARMLKEIGIDAQAMKDRSISFHSLRHVFVTLARSAGLSDIDVQTLAGHASAEMMDRYSHGAQIIDIATARKAIESVLKQKKG